MPWDFKFDPVTKDFISDGAGSYVTTQNADTMVMHQFLCEYPLCWHDENLGSRLADMQYLQPDPQARAEADAKRSLNVLQSRGRVANIEVDVQMESPSRVDIATRFRDTSSGQVVTTSTNTGG